MPRSIRGSNWSEEGNGHEGPGHERARVQRRSARASCPLAHGRSQAMKRLLKNFAFTSGALLTVGLILVALAAPLLAPFDPDDQDTSRRLESPSKQHVLGLDDLGRDV